MPPDTEHPSDGSSTSPSKSDGQIEVFDIWESQEALEAWGPEGFVPILLDLGVELHPPTIHPVHNTIHG